MEDFALALDRRKVLDNLVPGSEDDYRFRTLEAEHRGALGEVDELLERWKERHGETGAWQTARLRLRLHRLAADDKDAHEQVRRELGLTWGHSQQIPGRTTKRPTAVPERELTAESLFDRAWSNSSLGYFKDHALTRTTKKSLDRTRRRDLLNRIGRPDVPGLVELILEDLAEQPPYAAGWGTYTIHDRLLVDQYEELAARKPDLRSDHRFITSFILRLQPGPDEAWRTDPTRRGEWLGRLWSFVRLLEPSFNSLKANALFHLLDNERRQGRYPRELFTEYLELPRSGSLTDSTWLNKPENRYCQASLSERCEEVTLCPPIGDDRELVEDFLRAIFLESEDLEPWQTFVADRDLKRILAETRLLAGDPKAEHWTSLLPGSQDRFRALRDEIRLRLTCRNAAVYKAGEAVALEAEVKNIPRLVVKVFEINTFNYYRTKRRELDTSLDLDGLVAPVERVLEFDEPAMRSVTRRIELPEITRRGVYVVELIGGGLSSRALIRIGALQLIERVGSAGHIFKVIDENAEPVDDATLWIAEQEYRPDDKGAIRVPFSRSPGREPVLIRQGDFTVLASFQHRSETYTFDSCIHIEREQLIPGETAKILVRGALALHGNPVPAKLIEDLTLVITTTDKEGVDTSGRHTDLSLDDEGELVHELHVPGDLASIKVELSGQVPRPSQGDRQKVEASMLMELNAIDSTSSICDLFLQRSEDGCRVLVLGKTGEIRPAVQVRINLHPRDYAFSITHYLQADEQGVVTLGDLREFVKVEASAEGVSREWELTPTMVELPSELAVAAGEPWVVPIPFTCSRKDRDVVSFIAEREDGLPLRDHFEDLQIRPGFLGVSGLPAGDYSLWIKPAQRTMKVRVVDGAKVGGRLVSERRMLRETSRPVLQILKAIEQGGKLCAALSGCTPHTRVHVFATRFTPPSSALAMLRRKTIPEAGGAIFERPISTYISGRELSDELRYILERRNHRQFAGNTLPHPGVILNPFVVSDTDTARDEGKGGADPFGAGGAGQSSQLRGSAVGGGGVTPGDSGSNLDFLTRPALVLTNIQPDEHGEIQVEADLSGCQEVILVAVDRTGAVAHRMNRPLEELDTKDLRLLISFDHRDTLSEQKRISLLESGSPLLFEDPSTTEFEVIGSLSSAWKLLTTLQDDPVLERFAPLLKWPDLERSRRLELYDDLASHELHLFVWSKDPQFFDAVIKPYLLHKAHKTFMDECLLGLPLHHWLTPRRYRTLNILERILLARSLKDGEPTRRHVDELARLSPLDLSERTHLFRTALRGSGHEAPSEELLAAKSMALGRAMERQASAPPPPAMAAPPGGMAFGAPPPAPRRSRSAAKKRKAAKRDMAYDMMEEAEEMEMMADVAMSSSLSPFDDLVSMDKEAEFDDNWGDDDMALRQQAALLHIPVEKTKEYAENNWFERRISEQGPDLITVNGFWRDYADHVAKNADAPFISTNLAEAHHNRSEVLAAIALTDLPFTADKPALARREHRLEISTSEPAICFHQEVRPADDDDPDIVVLCNQTYLREGDRTRVVEGQTVDKPVRDEFLTFRVYVCKVVLTNPTSRHLELELLMQIPRGSLPVAGGQATKTHQLRLGAHGTTHYEVAFYFPEAGDYPHYPARVSRNEKAVSAAEALTLHVVETSSKVDTESWEYVSQQGSAEDVFRFLETANLQELNLERIAWRMQERPFYDRAIAWLEQRHAWCDALWSYSFKHFDKPRMKDWFALASSLPNKVGRELRNDVVEIDPVFEGWFEILEYMPLINARMHPFGGERKILNDRFKGQFRRFTDHLCAAPGLSADQRLLATVYLILQERLEDALEQLGAIDEASLTCRMQFDYTRAWLALCEGRPDAARAAIEPWRELEIPRWRKLFARVASQLEEIEGKAALEVDPKEREEIREQATRTQPGIELVSEDGGLVIESENLESCELSIYRVDLELMFSREPFVQQQSDQFGFIKPGRRETLSLPGAGLHRTPIVPADDERSANLIVEVTAAGLRRSAALTANNLSVRIDERFGLLQVRRRSDQQPLPRCYVKVYARIGGRAKFYKDGATDLRGRFDYTSLSTSDLDNVQRFAILVISPEDGSVTREVAPPKS